MDSSNSYDTNGVCAECGVCGNGRCEPQAGENDTNCQDCVNVVGGSCGPTTEVGCGDLDGCCGFNTLVSGAPACQGSDRTNTDTFDTDCSVPPICGNGVLEAGEECDLGGSTPIDCTNTSEICDATTCQCNPTVCGDGVVKGTETCDPPQSVCNAGTGPTSGTCNDLCQCEANPPPPVVCGDGKVEGTEECDPPGITNQQTGEGCDSSCKIIPLPLCTVEGGGCGKQASPLPPCRIAESSRSGHFGWMGAFLPGGVFAVVRFRKRH